MCEPHSAHPNEQEWPPLKIIFHVLRYVMPIEFTVVGKNISRLFAQLVLTPCVAVAFFDTKWSFERCQSFYLFEPIVTMFLVSLCSGTPFV